jgi:hypothetical protein
MSEGAPSTTDETASPGSHEDGAPEGSSSLGELTDSDARSRSLALNDRVPASGLFGEATRPLVEGSRASWRIAPEPFLVTPASYQWLQQLGNNLLAFYGAANRLYRRSVRGTMPSFFHEYLDIGKSESVIDYGRMNRFRRDLPGIIRPDLLLTADGVKAAELDSVPGGIGLTGSMQQHYSSLGFTMAGGANGMAEGFAAMIRSHAGKDDPQLAIAVSDESSDYRPEMQWLSDQLCELGMSSACAKPEEIVLRDDCLMLDSRPIDTLYRFLELFDLKNIPNYDLLLYAARKQLITITPPLKAYLEEKLLFALFHHPALAEYWKQEMGAKTVTALMQVIPQTWILDPRPLPPQAVVPGIEIAKRPVTDWNQLLGLGQADRRLVIKPSGYSANAWGSRGVTIGHDHPESEWDAAVQAALDAFGTTPHVLQKFHHGNRYGTRYYDFAQDTVRKMHGRVRMSPYYFVENEETTLGGILVTIVPADKKLIHGMVDAVMVPAAVSDDGVDLEF